MIRATLSFPGLFSGLLSAVLLAGCSAIVPSEGPIASDILKDGGHSSLELGRETAAVFEVVDVDSSSARIVSDFTSMAFVQRFGKGGRPERSPIAIGDQIKIIVFEAGPDGLFSTADKKQMTLDVVVQPDGRASIPYVGRVRFADRTVEEVRQVILKALEGKAVEPDVLVSSVTSTATNVTISGAVGKSAVFPISLSGERLSDVIAKAGGPTSQPYETYITLVRGDTIGTALLKTIIENPHENIYVQPGDQIFIVTDPRTFTLLGSVNRNARVPFSMSDVNLLEAIAMGGGGDGLAVDAEGYFLFRYEDDQIVERLLGPVRFSELKEKGMSPDKLGRYPIVYRFDMKNPDSLVVGQLFPIKSRDILYASRHPSADFQKFLSIVGTPVGLISQGAGMSRNFDYLTNGN